MWGLQTEKTSDHNQSTFDGFICMNSSASYDYGLLVPSDLAEKVLSEITYK